jgi:hypothetical protein
MIDRDAVAMLPTPHYACRQASSWDRSQTVVGGRNWFANNDYDQYLRKETQDGRSEYVIMEDSGPGCVTRIWKPLREGTKGARMPRMTIRFYLDGETDPVIETSFTQLLSSGSIFSEPFSFIASDEKNVTKSIGLPEGYLQRGGDLYFPIPYTRGCKITVEPRPEPGDAPNNVFFYIINYRSYEAGTQVRSFSMKEYETGKQLVSDVGRQLSKPGACVAEVKHVAKREDTVQPGASLSVELPSGSGAVREFVVQLDPKVHPSVVRDLWVSMSFDGRQTVYCPFSEFFGGGYFPADAHHEAPDADGVFIRPHWNWNRRVEQNGRFSCWFVMPYGSSASVAVDNKGKLSIPVRMSVDVGSWEWDNRSMHFHAGWRTGETPAQHADWNYTEIKGQGTYVADTLSIYNPVKGWYGEGDERIYIDGEPFPSHLGTGTEDYYGYAWGMANHWSSPFISCPDRDARGKGDWSGYQTVSRERMLDGITFRKSLKVDMEAWNGAGVHYSVGTMWYARPGASSNRGPVSMEPDPAKPIVRAGAIECESLKVHKRSAGVVTEVQSLAPVGSHRFSNGAHLFVRPPKIGGFVELKVGAPERRRVVLHGLKSWDYGIVRISVNGRAAGKDLDMFSQTIVPTGPMDLGVSDPVDGAFMLRFEVVGKNPKSKHPGLYFGLDCIELQE